MNHLYHISDYLLFTVTADYLDLTQQTIFGLEVTNRNLALAADMRNKNGRSSVNTNAIDLYELSIDSLGQ